MPLSSPSMHACAPAWTAFDTNVGWFVGLDEPKFKWAILERERQLRQVRCMGNSPCAHAH